VDRRQRRTEERRSAWPITTSKIADVAWVERQKAGTAGFTAFVTSRSTAERCAPSARAAARNQSDRRSTASVRRPKRCATSHLPAAFERRPLYAPQLGFEISPYIHARRSHGAPVEVYELLAHHARARGRSCLALDRTSRALR